jgi:hypothetical protein
MERTDSEEPSVIAFRTENLVAARMKLSRTPPTLTELLILVKARRLHDDAIAQ